MVCALSLKQGVAVPKAETLLHAGRTWDISSLAWSRLSNLSMVLDSLSTFAQGSQKGYYSLAVQGYAVSSKFMHTWLPQPHLSVLLVTQGFSRFIRL